MPEAVEKAMIWDAAPADPMINMIERVMMDPSVDVGKLERFLALREREGERQSRVSFAMALSQARAEIPPIIKDATVDFKNKSGQSTRYAHETLAGIARTIDPILASKGLSYRWRTDQKNSQVIVTCIVSHRDGYSEETTLSGSPDGSGNKNGFQAVGSAVTYLQRYTLKAALGLSVAADDDATALSNHDESVEQLPLTIDPGPLLMAISKAETLEDLRGIWLALSNEERQAPGVAAHKDARKTQLDVAKTQAEMQQDHNNEFDDFIPYQGAEQQ